MSAKAKVLHNAWAGGDFDVEDAPNHLEVIHDHSKTVITLATAVLGLTAAFFDRFVSTDAVWQRRGLGLVWVLLLIAIFTAFLSSVQLQRYTAAEWVGNASKGTKLRRRLGLVATASYLALCVALIVLGSLALARHQTSVDAESAIRKASEFMRTASPDKTWVVRSMRDDSTDGFYSIELETTPGSGEARIEISGSTGEVRSLSVHD